MHNDHDERLDALFAKARPDLPDTSGLETHFETRFMARLAERRAKMVPWQMLVWRMLPGFAVLAAIMLICSLSLNPTRSSDPFAAITNSHDEQMAKNYLLGE
ncbi:MAG TPA: hypothetical protein VGJ93_15935 [Desulfuromonadaceae bacterium]|jgi:hypothetical protein